MKMFCECKDRSRFFSWLVIGVCSWATLGCGKAQDGFDGPRGEVQGTITFKGEPIPEGSGVLFQSAKGKSYLATGAVQADGKYRLTYEGARQMPAVDYKVQITPPRPQERQAPIDTVNADPEQMKPEAMIEAAKAKAEEQSAPFPEKYFSLQTSKLTFTVEEGQNVADFDLEE